MGSEYWMRSAVRGRSVTASVIGRGGYEAHKSARVGVWRRACNNVRPMCVEGPGYWKIAAVEIEDLRRCRPLSIPRGWYRAASNERIAS